jgi:hypothetical protein
MKELTQTQQQTQQRNAITIANLLQGVSITFAQINFTTDVKTAAAHKALHVTKTTDANVQLFSNVQAAVYANAVKRSAAKTDSNDATAVENFKAQENYFEHSDCFSIVQHKTEARLYLYSVFNRAKSEFYIDGVPATREQVGALLTPSEAKKLFSDGTVHNVTHNIEHDVTVRTVGLHNINSIKAMGQSITL